MKRYRRIRLAGANGSSRRRLLSRLLIVGGLVIALLALAPAAGAGPREIIWDWDATPSWFDTLSGPGALTDIAEDVKLAKGNVTFVAGEISNTAGNPDIGLTKYKGSVLQWTKVYDGSGNGLDIVEAMALSRDGKFVYITGQSENGAGNSDLIVVKRAAGSGALKWAKRYDGPAHRDDDGHAIGVDRNGNVTAAGYSVNAAGNPDWIVVSWRASGARRWTYRYAGSGGSLDIIEDAIVNDDGTVYAGGYSSTVGNQRAVTARISPSGRQVWRKTFAGSDGLGAVYEAIAARPGGGVYAGGYVSMTATGHDGLVVGYNAKGRRTLVALDTAGGGVTDEEFLDIAVASTKDIVAVGFTFAAGNDDCRVVAFRPDGLGFGGVTVPGAWSDWFRRVATDSFGGYYCIGTNHVAAGDSHYAVWRGSLITGGGGWYGEWGPVASSYNVPKAIAVRGTTACVVGQCASGGPTGTDQAVLMYIY